MLKRLFQDPVPDMATAIRRAEQGAAFLERLYGADWHQQVSAERLEISSPVCCVLGQLMRQGHWRMAFLPLNDAVNCGFSCGLWDFLFFAQPPWVSRSFDRLTEAWKLLLRERHARDAAPQTRLAQAHDSSVDRRDSGHSSFHCAN